MLNGDAREAAAVLDGALRAAGRDSGDQQCLEARWLAASLVEPSLRPEARRRIARLGALEAKRDSPALLAVVACHLALTGRSREEAVRLATGALADGRGDDPAAWAPALQALSWCGEFDQAVDAAELAARWCGRNGRGLASARLAAAHGMHLAGRLREAERSAQAALGLTGGIVGDYVDSPHARLAAIMIDRGNIESAESRIRGGLDALPSDDSVVRALVLGVSAAVHSARHRHAEALADAIEAGRILERAGAGNPAVSSWRSQAALAAAAIGEQKRARQLAQEEVRLARRFGSSTALGVALGRAAALESNGSAVGLLTEAEAVLERSGARVEHARVLGQLGAALRRRGSLKEARRTLRQTLDTATQLGCGRIARQALSELQLTGARPRSNIQSGTDALTAAERRVAKLAAVGLTNREIAQELVVTKKTVEWHLGNVYRKLDVESREELPGELDREPSLVATA
jgi:DNA-binding CsgD family transcriptional regulator